MEKSQRHTSVPLPLRRAPRKRGRRPIPLLRQRIIRSAAELFGERGFDAVLTDEVAARAGVGKGSIYRQFGSKEQLYAEAVIDGFVQLRRRIESALDDTHSEHERIKTIAAQMLSYFWDRGQFFVLMRDPTRLPRAQHARFLSERAKVSSLIGKLLREHARSGRIRNDLDFDLMTEALLGMIRGIRRFKSDRTTLDDAITTVVALFLEGALRGGRSRDAG